MMKVVWQISAMSYPDITSLCFHIAKIALILGFWRIWPNLVHTRQFYVSNAREYKPTKNHGM